MKRSRELLEEWQFPHLVHGGVTLIRRSDCESCVRRILSDRCVLHGYEGFKLFEDGRVQPDMEWSASWSVHTVPPLDAVLSQIYEIPSEVTHVEFVFSKVT